MNKIPEASLKDWESRLVGYLTLHLGSEDGSHDLGHFRRVWKTAQYINEREGGEADLLILLAAAYFHDIVSFPKNHPDRSLSSLRSSERAVSILAEMGDFPPEKMEGVRHAIHAHSFSAGVETRTAEARILQDADRLEALGAIGLARVFYTGGQLNQLLFDAGDPLARERAPDDKRYSLDHFAVKLFKLPALMNTKTGRELALANAAYLQRFVAKINAEIDGDYLTGT